MLCQTWSQAINKHQFKIVSIAGRLIIVYIISSVCVCVCLGAGGEGVHVCACMCGCACICVCVCG